MYQKINKSIAIQTDETGVMLCADCLSESGRLIYSRKIYLFDKEMEAVIKAYQEAKEKPISQNQLKLGL